MAIVLFPLADFTDSPACRIENERIKVEFLVICAPSPSILI